MKTVSVVIPAYKQEKTIVKNVKSVEKILQGLPWDYEIIIVVDGKVDKTHLLIKRMKNKKIKIVAYEKNQGKGFAVKQGMLKAKGDVIGFIDAGGDINLSVIPMALDYMELYNADIVIGSKLHSDSLVNYPLSRKILSWGYRTITRVLFRFNVKDTQVGVKFFKRAVAKKVFRKIIVKKFAFDVEVLTVAALFGYKNIHEIPIKLKFNQGSINSRNFLKASILTFWDTAAVFYRLRILRYYTRKK